MPAINDANSVNENSGIGATGNVVTNDSDVARLSQIVYLDRNGVSQTATFPANTNNITLTTRYGMLVINRTGAYTYTLDDSLAAVNALNTGATLDETFTYTGVNNGGNNPTNANLVLTINGANDAPTLSGDLAITVGEGGSMVVTTADLNSSDVDSASRTFIVTGTTHGHLELSTGPGTPVTGFTQAQLAAGEVLFVHDGADNVSAGFTVTVSDEVASAGPVTVSAAVTLIDDPATIGGDDSGAVTEDGPLTNSGTLTVTDPDGPEDELQPIAAGTAGDNGYGTFEVGANGVWTYTLDNGNPAVQALGAGDTLTDTITVTSEDGSDTHQITITITGANDTASIAGDDSGDVSEDGTLTASGTLTITDIDNGEAELQPVVAGTAGDNGYGTFEVGAGGSWTYNLDNSNAAVQAIGFGETLTHTITVTSEDGSDTHQIIVTITGANDTASIAGDNTGDVSEDSTVTASGTMTVTDIDDGEAELQPIAAGTAGDNGHGTFEVGANGSWTYSLDNGNAAVQALSFGATLTDMITVTSEDGSDTHQIIVTITGANDTASIGGDDAGDVSEDGILAASGTLTVTDIDDGEAELQPIAAGTAGDTGYGTFEVAADGTWTYSLDNGNAAVQGLGFGETLTDTITVTSEDGSDTHQIIVTITGDNDGASVGGDDTGDVSEDGSLTASGTLTVTDTDDGEAELQPIAAGTAGDNSYGSFEVGADGSWTYSLDNGNAAVQALGAGDMLTDTITVTSEDGSDTHQITVTINGANDAASIGGDDTGDISEDGTLTASGTLSVTDIDDGEAELQPITAGTAGDNGYGTFEVGAGGGWTYSLENSNAAVQALGFGEMLTDTITVTSEDGSDTYQIIVTITGANDGASVGGEDTGDVSEDGTLAASGTLTITDTDDGEAELQPITAGTAGDNGYGTFEVSADGNWAYSLDNGDAAVQSLGFGETLTDTITVMSEDGSDAHQIIVTITGANDGASVGGDDTGDVSEDGSLTASGALTVTDTDDGEAELQPIAAGTAGDNGYGTFAVAGDGTWTYSLDNSDADVQALGAGDMAIDTITVTSEDGSDTHQITVTINGANDAASIGGDDTGDVSEDGTLTASGVLTITDVDDGEAELQPVAAGTSGDNGYGTFEVAADGSWTYSLDNGNADVQALSAAGALTDMITVASEDGSDTRQITVTINGANDGASIGGDDTGDVDEDGTLTASGTLSITDIDDGEAELQPITAGTAGDNGYGTFEVGADGSWTYSLDNGDAAVRALGTGDMLTDTITVTSEDGSDTHQITVTITGANDGASIGGDDSGDVTEEGPLTASGTLTVSDVDAGEDALQPIAAGTAGDNGYGTFEVGADGTWTYTLDNSNAAVQALEDGEMLADSITVTSEDGTDTHQINVTIHGLSDVPTITFTGGPDDDTYVVAPDSNVFYVLNGEGGSDVLGGGALHDEIDGGQGDDQLYGEGGDDHLVGGPGNDYLDGGSGADVMDGAGGDDTYVVDDGGDAVNEGSNQGADTVLTTLASYTLGSHVENLTGTSGSGQALNGNGLANVITGAGGDDSLNGNGGDDTLDGGQGADDMDGGSGDDTYHVDDAGDVVTEGLDQGNDQVFATISYTLTPNVENLILDGTDPIDGTGNDLANAITGNDAANIIDGGLGADTMAGGRGDDVYRVDDAGDNVTEEENEGHDKIISVVSYVLGDHVEDLFLDGEDPLDGTGNALDNSITGSDGDNHLDGGDGNDIVLGRAGNDIMVGGAGDDRMLGGNDSDQMSGGTGDDAYFVRQAGDTVIEGLDEGHDKVTAFLDHILADNVEDLVLMGGARHGTGNALANALFGTNGNDRLEGLEGDDILRGKSGVDELHGGAGDDTAYGGLGDDHLVGEDGHDRLIGDNGDDIMEGGDGNDFLYGRQGRDTLDGGAGNDDLIGGIQRDTLTGGAGADRFGFDDGDAGATLAAADEILDFSRAEGDKVRLRQMDANTGTGADDNFTFIGTGAFTGIAGELRYAVTGADSIVQGDTNGDGVADFFIRVENVAVLLASDFVL